MSRETWEYNPGTDTWWQRRNLPEPRMNATGFAINGKGYVAMGITPSDNLRDDVLEYDPVLNSWRTKSILTVPGQDMGRRKAVSFVINNKAYIGTGETGTEDFHDFWEFDPQTNAWVRKADLPGEGRRGAMAFTIGSLGYVGTGHSTGTPELNDFWSYNRSSNSWTRKANVPGNGRAYAPAFSIGSHGYVGMGYLDGNILDLDNFYRYSISTVGSSQNQ